MPKDTVIIRIEQEDYQLALQQAQATAASHRAQLREVELQKGNLQTEIKIVKKKLNLAKVELSRIQSLVKRQSISKSSRDTQQVNVLKLQQEVQKLNHQLITEVSQSEVSQLLSS